MGAAGLHHTTALGQVLECHSSKETLLENNNQLQLSSIKGAILVSNINLVSNRPNVWKIKFPDTVTFRTTVSPGVLSTITPLLSTMLLISAPLFLLKGKHQSLTPVPFTWYLPTVLSPSPFWAEILALSHSAVVWSLQELKEIGAVSWLAW